MKLVTILVLIFSLLQESYQTHCNSHPLPAGNSNSAPIWDDEPVLIKTVKNGKLYQVGNKAYNNTIDLLHVYGTMYEMGEAQGRIYGSKLQQFIDAVKQFAVEEASDDLPWWMSDQQKEDTILFGANVALDLTYQMTVKYTKPEYYVELKGMCDASGANYDDARRVQLLGELTKGHCSMFGAWGDATSEGQTIQLRALDWTFEDGPFRDYATIVVYHPATPEIGNTFANIGLMGFLGSLSGVNDKKMAISEIGVSYPDVLPEEAPSWGTESREGNPFTFVLRDILQFTSSLDQAIDYMQNTQRTCNLILGVGDGKEESLKHFRAFQYSYSVCNVIGDDNLIPRADWHPEIKDIVYFGMDWNCPNWDIVFAQILEEYYGKITAEIAIRNIVGAMGTGDLQAVVYDLANEFTYVSYGFISGDYVSKAYENPFVKLDLKKLFAEKL